MQVWISIKFAWSLYGLSWWHWLVWFIAKRFNGNKMLRICLVKCLLANLYDVWLPRLSTREGQDKKNFGLYTLYTWLVCTWINGRTRLLRTRTDLVKKKNFLVFWSAHASNYLLKVAPFKHTAGISFNY